MKFFLFTLFVITGICNAQVSTSNLKIIKHHNKIDDVNSADDVQLLLDTLLIRHQFSVNKNLDFPDSSCRYLRNYSKAKSWIKVDLDKNGYTDLVLVGEPYVFSNIVCIMDSGENKFFFKGIPNYFEKCSFPISKKLNNSDAILIYHYAYFNSGFQSDTSKIEIDTLAFEEGDFINYNPLPKHYKIQKIKFEIEEAFCICPVFELVINSDNSMEYNALKFNKIKNVDIAGKFNSTLDKILLIKLLVY